LKDEHVERVAFHVTVDPPDGLYQIVARDRDPPAASDDRKNELRSGE
jgi:hypothetical protein